MSTQTEFSQSIDEYINRYFGLEVNCVRALVKGYTEYCSRHQTPPTPYDDAPDTLRGFCRSLIITPDGIATPARYGISLSSPNHVEIETHRNDHRVICMRGLPALTEIKDMIVRHDVTVEQAGLLVELFLKWNYPHLFYAEQLEIERV